MANKYNTFVFKEEQYPIVNQHLAQKKNSDKFQRYIKSYVDKNSEVLFENSPIHRLYFKDNDFKIVYDVTGLESKDIESLVKKNKLTESSWRLFNNPFNWAMMVVLSYYHKKKMKKEFEASLMYLTLSLYASLHFKYFKYVPNENIMRYTINNLSGKYYIKKYGILFKALFETAMNSHETYSKYLDEMSDRQLIEYIMNLRTRLNSFVQNVAKEYYKNSEEGNYINFEADSSDEDNYFETDNISFLIDRLSSTVMNDVLTNGINLKIANLSAEMCGVSRTAIRVALDNILEKENERIKELIVLILQQYLVEEGNSADIIGTKYFINDCLKLYSKSNTVDENVLRIKEILDEWLTENSDKYIKTERVATKSSFRRAIFMYFVFCIQQTYTNH